MLKVLILISANIVKYAKANSSDLCPNSPRLHVPNECKLTGSNLTCNIFLAIYGVSTVILSSLLFVLCVILAKKRKKAKINNTNQI